MKKIAIISVVLLLTLLTQWLEYKKPAKITPEIKTISNAAITLSKTQSEFVKVKPVIEHNFQASKDAVGTISFSDEKTIQVYPNYAGKIHRLFIKLGDYVKVDQPLYSINSPDLLQAESTLISSAATRELSTKALNRAQALLQLKAMAEKDYQQAVSDQQTAEGAFQSAIKNLKIFGKTDTEIQTIIQSKHVDPELIVRSPIQGKVISFNNPAPGAYVQPGTPPAPMAVSDTNVKWMIANISESDISVIKLGQNVDVRVPALNDSHFHGIVTNIGSQIDPNTHSILVRSEVKDENQLLIPGMLAYFSITTSNLNGFPAVPFESVVRQGDGSLAVWVTKNGHDFEKRLVSIGQQQDGLYQILSGLQIGEQVATQGAVFVSHAYDMSTE